MGSDKNSNFSAYDVDEIGSRGEAREALDLALEAIRAGAWENELFLVGANLAFRLGDLDKAAQLVNSFLVRDPDHINGWLLFGNIHRALGDLARADYGRRRAEDLFPALKEMEIQVDKSKTAETADRQSAAGIGDGEAINFDTMTFAEICTRQGYYNKALKIYHELLKKNPHDPELKRRIEELNKRLGHD